MSLAINPDKVVAVLLADGHWHSVERGTFDLDAYEYVLEHEGLPSFEDILHGGGNAGVCATGFTYKDKTNWFWVSGPLTAIQAVRIDDYC